PHYHQQQVQYPAKHICFVFLNTRPSFTFAIIFLKDFHDGECVHRPDQGLKKKSKTSCA
ncbi:hypothetical protein ANANG_G00122320, partial [Anguilla anguilla]